MLVLLAGLVGCVEKESQRKPQVIPPDDPPVVVDPDPITEVETPGAYGAEGGTLLFEDPRFQTSILKYGTSMSVRVLDPENRNVVSFSGLPTMLRPGQKLSFLYRVSRSGLIAVSHRYPSVTVIQIKDGKVWLKQDDNCYFVLEI